MSTTVIRLRRDAMSSQLPENAAVGSLVVVEMFGQPVRDGEPGRITELDDTWVQFGWDTP